MVTREVKSVVQTPCILMTVLRCALSLESVRQAPSFHSCTVSCRSLDRVDTRGVHDVRLTLVESQEVGTQGRTRTDWDVLQSKERR